MNADKFLNSRVGGYIALGCLGAAIVWYMSKKAEAAGKTAADFVNTYLNPASDKNLVYAGVNKVGSVATGDDSWSLGSALYDFTHPTYNPNETDSGILDWIYSDDSLMGKAVAGLGDWKNIDLDFDVVNPASDKNLVYTGVNKVGAAATGDDSFSLGSWIYDIFHPDEGKNYVSEDKRIINSNNNEGIN